jgi:hypothetical protein
MEFLIGDPVKWKGGPFDMKGLYLEQLDDVYSLVLCTQQDDVRRKIELKVLTEALEKDE